ncbi:DUF58 domain-containing protein [Georgenia ruanii]|uniref:DUF58 domain-containing protein n=1 Tax=Georgenia ruanii TaxID=348442 RepID=UPI0031CDDF3B
MRPLRLTTRGLAFLAAGLAAVLAAVVLGYPDITRIGVLLAALPALAVLTGWRRTPRLGVRRSVAPDLLWPDGEATVTLEVRNEGRRPTLPFLATERLDPALGDAPRLVLPPLRVGERHAATYRLHPARRGVYALGPLALELRDPFGLTRAGLEPGDPAELVVLPRVHELGGVRLRREGDAGDWHVPHSVAPQGEDDISTRHYRYGDDLRRVHWPATAHRGQLMVRQEERPARRRATLVLDSRAKAHWGTDEDGSFEWAVSALASVAVHLGRQGWSLSLVSADTVREGTAARVLGADAVLRELARARVHWGDLDPVLRAARELPAGAVVAVATDHDEPALRRLVPARPHGAAGVLLLVRAETFAPGALADPPGPGAADRADRLARLARAGGWRTAVARAGDPPSTVWPAATAARPARTAARTVPAATAPTAAVPTGTATGTAEPAGTAAPPAVAR